MIWGSFVDKRNSNDLRITVNKKWLRKKIVRAWRQIRNLTPGSIFFYINLNSCVLKAAQTVKTVALLLHFSLTTTFAPLYTETNLFYLLRSSKNKHVFCQASQEQIIAKWTQ